MSLNDLAARQHADSVRWFPSVHQPTDLTVREHAVVHFALGVAGEAGEIANKVKKFFGYKDQSTAYTEEWLVEQLSDEIPDVIVYLLDLAVELGIDLERALRDKHGVCMARWERGYTWDTVPIGHVVPGSGEIMAKSPHASGYHVRFRRVEPGFAAGEEWVRYVNGREVVPIALTSKGLLEPHPKNVVREADS